MRQSPVPVKVSSAFWNVLAEMAVVPLGVPMFSLKTVGGRAMENEPWVRVPEPLALAQPRLSVTMTL